MQELVNQIQQKIGCINSGQLKMLAIILMTIDHVGFVLFPRYTILRKIGRLAFPIFAYLIAEGMYYTRDVKKYLLRLGVFALVSEIPFDYAFRGSYWYPNSQNVFFTLLIGAACIYIYQTAEEKYMKLSFVVFLSFLAELMSTDYGMLGVWLIFGLYLTRGKWLQTFLVLAVLNILLWDGIQAYATLAFIPLMLYNGEKGNANRSFFYVYYPMHLIVLRCIVTVLNYY